MRSMTGMSPSSEKLGMLDTVSIKTDVSECDFSFKPTLILSFSNSKILSRCQHNKAQQLYHVVLVLQASVNTPTETGLVIAGFLKLLSMKPVSF